MSSVEQLDLFASARTAAPPRDVVADRDELRVACPLCRVLPGVECKGSPVGWSHGVRGGVAAAWLAMEHEALGVELDVIDRMHPPGSAHRRWIEGADARECFPKAFGSRRKNADDAAEAA